jgi:large subunit ribosomal protein L23
MSIVKHPYITEKSTELIDEGNMLQFIVDINASKRQIKIEIEKLFDVRVEKVRTMITPRGDKRAIVTLSEEDSADEIMTRLGVF